MPVLGLNGTEFYHLASQILGSGNQLRFQAKGQSMQPLIQDGDILIIVPLAGNPVHMGDVLLVDAGDGRLLAHRVIKLERRDTGMHYLIKMDAGASPDGWFTSDAILGRVEVLERGASMIRLTSSFAYWKARVWLAFAPWASKFTWLPERFRQHIREWLLV